MRLLFLVLAVGVTGCATTHQPGSLQEPTTLASVNRALDGEKAQVFFNDGRPPERLYFEVGPHTSRASSNRRAPLYPGAGRWTVVDDVQEIPTSLIERIEIDDSLSPGEGAWSGLKVGVGTGAVLLGAGLALTLVDGSPNSCPSICFTAGEAVAVVGAATTIGGVVLGPPIGAASTAKRYPVTIYQAPVTRYPDAALALLEREAEATSPAASN